MQRLYTASQTLIKRPRWSCFIFEIAQSWFPVSRIPKTTTTWPISTSRPRSTWHWIEQADRLTLTPETRNSPGHCRVDIAHSLAPVTTSVRNAPMQLSSLGIVISVKWVYFLSWKSNLGCSAAVWSGTHQTLEMVLTTLPFLEGIFGEIRFLREEIPFLRSPSNVWEQ